MCVYALFQNITTINVSGSIVTGGFVKAKSKVTRGSENVLHEFTYVDMSNRNPHNWIMLVKFLMLEEQKYEPILAHIKRMLVLYICEVAKLQIEIVVVLKRKPTINPIGRASDISEM
ncbi:unnamed protein product [Lactuca saligna]|uniref:Uncharacterized protein n=1 Tax=Lactuca saligna TaxID=75948 RepID=A0AA35YMG9_LACSI|nr:unnamed protein product [Lactuca saligna]